MSTNYIFIKRLLKLSEFLDKLPKKRFDYSHWVGDDWGGKKDLSCGTSACALGWATAIPSLRKAGLRMKSVSDGTVAGAGFVGLKESTEPDGMQSLEAGKKVFGLNDDEFEYLFHPGSSVPANLMSKCKNKLYAPDEDATPKQLAKHIRNFVKMKYDVSSV